MPARGVARAEEAVSCRPYAGVGDVKRRPSVSQPLGADQLDRRGRVEQVAGERHMAGEQHRRDGDEIRRDAGRSAHHHPRAAHASVAVDAPGRAAPRRASTTRIHRRAAAPSRPPGRQLRDADDAAKPERREQQRRQRIRRRAARAARARAQSAAEQQREDERRASTNVTATAR